MIRFRLEQIWVRLADWIIKDYQIAWNYIKESDEYG